MPPLASSCWTPRPCAATWLPRLGVCLLGRPPQGPVPDELFADLFPSGRGRPSVPADQVATVMVLQALEGLSDREAAAQQLACNIAWKVACGAGPDRSGLPSDGADLVAQPA